MIYDIVADDIKLDAFKLDAFETLDECKDWVEQHLSQFGFGQFKTIKIYAYGFDGSPTMMEGYYAEPDTTTPIKTVIEIKE